MDEATRDVLDKLIDPLIPARIGVLERVAKVTGCDISEPFVIGVLAEEKLVPVTDHPLHQKKVLGLADEFAAAGLADVAGFLTERVLEGPGLAGELKEQALRRLGRRSGA